MIHNNAGTVTTGVRHGVLARPHARCVARAWPRAARAHTAAHVRPQHNSGARRPASGGPRERASLLQHPSRASVASTARVRGSGGSTRTARARAAPGPPCGRHAGRTGARLGPQACCRRLNVQHDRGSWDRRAGRSQPPRPCANGSSARPLAGATRAHAAAARARGGTACRLNVQQQLSTRRTAQMRCRRRPASCARAAGAGWVRVSGRSCQEWTTSTPSGGHEKC